MEKKTIMVIDDQEVVLQVMVSMLIRGGFEAVEFSGARKALEVLQAGVQVDAVIIDLLMPKLDGASAFLKIKELHPGLPVILSSGLPFVIIESRVSEENRPKWFLQKPFGMHDLLDVLGKALNTEA